MFALSKLVWWLLQPSRFWVLVVCLSTFLLFSSWFRLGRWLLLVATVMVLLTLSLPLHLYLARPLESRFPILELPEKIDGIIVLGGAVDQILTQTYGQASLNGAAERMTEALKLAQLHPEAKLVFSGGSAEVNPRSNFKESDVAIQFFRDLGISNDRLVLESKSRNTYENVLYSKELLKPQEGEIWLLVTSAMHMPRSVGIFRKLDWTVLPYPVDFRVGKNRATDPPRFFSDKLSIIDLASKEWLGLLSYKLMGRIDTFFPLPGK
ncbi:MAG: YdcF family protein [Trueperaceae bacterium]|nr:YdcF family protein [Trueperaceae bacterium]